MTPETFDAIAGLLESARAQAAEDRRRWPWWRRKGWAHQYAQDVGDLLAEVARLQHNEDKWRRATGAVVGHAQCPPGSPCR